MTDWVPISRTAHAKELFRQRQGYAHTRGRMVTPVMLGELPKVLPEYVIGFFAGDDGVIPVALLGSKREQNLYLHPDGHWLGQYIPAALRAYPFALAEDDKTLVIAADYLGEGGDTPLFEGDGLNRPVADVLSFLGECQSNRRATLGAAGQLQQAGVLSEWDLSIPIGDGKQQLNGLQCVDEQALNQLDADAYAALQGAPMQLAYAQLYSMAQVEQLTHRAELQQKLNPVATPSVDPDDLFGDDDDGLSFSF